MADSSGKKSSLRREAGVIGLLYASLGGIIGSGWLKGPMEAAQQAGPLSIFSWLAGGIAILLLALVYAELATMFPRSGAVVHFPHLSHGALLSRIWSWILFLGYVSVAPVEVLATLGYMANIWPWLIYPKDHALTPAGFGFAVLLLAIFTVLNLFGIKWVMRISTTAGWWKLAVPVITIIGLLIGAHHTANLHVQPHQMASNIRGVFTALGTAGVIFSFLGFRQAVELAGETSRPQRNIPIAVIGSVVIGMVIYIGLQLAFVMAINPASLAQYGWHSLDKAKGFTVGAGPLAALASGIGLAWLAMLLYADAIVSPGGTGFIYATTSSRVIGAMSEDGFIHGSLQRLNRFGVPWAASIVSFAVGCFFMLPFPSWHKMVNEISDVMVLSYGIGPVVLLSLRRTMPEANRPRPFRVPAANILAPITFIISNLIVYWSNVKTLSFIMALIGAALIVFLGWRVIKRERLSTLPWKNTWWVFPYLGGLWLLDFIGSKSMTGGLDYLRFPYDVGVVAVFSLIILYIAVNSAVPMEELQTYIDSL